MKELTIAATILAGGLAVAKPVVETGCALIEDLLGEPCKVAGGMLADEIYSWRWKNRIRIAARAKEIMKENDVSAKVVPKGFLIPLLDAAGDAEDPDLQEMWAHLLASAVTSETHQHPSYVMAMRQMSPLDARVFLTIVHGETGAIRKEDVERQFADENCVSVEDIRTSRQILHMVGLLGQSQAHISIYGKRFFFACSGESHIPPQPIIT